MFWLISLSVATSEFPNLYTGVTNIYGHHNLHFRAWSLYEGQYGLFTYSVQPSHWLFTITLLFVHLLIVHLLCNCKHSLFSFIILWAHCISQQQQLWISHTLYMNRPLPHTQAYAVLVSVHSLHHSGTRSGMFVLSLRSAEVLW